MAGFDNDVVYGTNIDLRGVQPVVGQFTTNGQLLIGSTAAPFARVGTLTSTGATITITPGAGTINLEATGGSGFTWNEVLSSPLTGVANNGYFSVVPTVVNLPAGAAIGATISFVNTAMSLVVNATGGAKIQIGTVQSTVNGSATSTADGDSLTLVYSPGLTIWYSIPGVQGNWLLA